MIKYPEILKKCELFAGLDSNSTEQMLSCFGAKAKSYKKGQFIIKEGNPAQEICIVLSGAVQIEKVDFYGNRAIVAKILPSHIFGESFVCAGAEHSPVNAVAAEETVVLLIDYKRMITPCANVCGFHTAIIYNLLKVTAQKNIMLNQKMEITSQRTTKEKLTAFLMTQAKQNNSDSFYIPYDRQELADYLCVDRSGLSAEIGKLIKEGKIESRKKYFRILDI